MLKLDYVIPGLAVLIIGVLIYAICLNVKLADLEKKIAIQEEVTSHFMIRQDSVDLHTLDLSKENFEYVCLMYNIKHPEIVYAQAQLESGYFTSKVFRTKNNFLGLYNSKIHDYYAFDHWTDCLLTYKAYVQNKWDGNGDYYQFLIDLPYAMDPNYIFKIKRLVKA